MIDAGNNFAIGVRRGGIRAAIAVEFDDVGPGMDEKPLNGLAGPVEAKSLLKVKKLASHVDGESHSSVPRSAARHDLAVPILLVTPL